MINSNHADVELMHKAIDKLVKSITNKGFNTGDISKITVSKRWNPNTGHHVHASCSVNLRFDESISDNMVDKPVIEKY